MMIDADAASPARAKCGIGLRESIQLGRIVDQNTDARPRIRRPLLKQPQ
jgi:hypothetical protein